MIYPEDVLIGNILVRGLYAVSNNIHYTITSISVLVSIIEEEGKCVVHIVYSFLHFLSLGELQSKYGKEEKGLVVLSHP